MNPLLPQTAVAALRQGRMIEAVKLVRLEQNIGLREAKDLIDRYLQSRPALKNRIDEANADAREGLLRWLMFLFIGGAGLAYLLS
jgi:ribosomal protein L7/L12